jgi:hypothetical protein
MSDYVLHVIIVRGCLRFGRWGLNRGTILSWHRLAKIYVIVMNESGNGAPDPRCTAIPKHCQGMLQLLAATLLLCWSTDEEQWPSTVTFTAKRQILALEERTASPPQRQPPLNCARPDQCVSPVAGGADTLAPDACATMHRHVCITA